jgi:hypothetical protein
MATEERSVSRGRDFVSTTCSSVSTLIDGHSFRRRDRSRQAEAALVTLFVVNLFLVQAFRANKMVTNAVESFLHQTLDGCAPFALAPIEAVSVKPLSVAHRS